MGMSTGVTKAESLTVWAGKSSELVSVPRDAPEAMWDGLPRAIMMWLSFEHPTPNSLFAHLSSSGYEAPAWMLEEGELRALNHVPSKGTRCVLVYRAMIENWLASGTLTEGGDAKQAPGDSLSGPVANGETPTTPRP